MQLSLNVQPFLLQIEDPCTSQKLQQVQYVKKDIAMFWNVDQCDKLDIIFPSFSCNFHDNFVELGLLTMEIGTYQLEKLYLFLKF